VLTLRLKLTLYYLAILTAILLFCGIAIYATLSRTLVSTIDQSLDVQVRKFERMVKNSTSETGFDIEPEANEPANDPSFNLPPELLQVIDDKGTIKDETHVHDHDELTVDLNALNRLPAQQTIHETVRTLSGEDFRLATRRGRGYDQKDFFVRVGQPLATLQRARMRLLLILGIAIPLALLLGSYGGLVLANQALHPVDQLTRAAEHITASDLNERVSVPAQNDELGRLAAQFNAMISRLQAAFERQRQFTSDASHELRTPLAVMRGEIELSLRRERTSAAYQHTLTSNLEEIVRLSRLVEDLLMLARADAGKVELQREPLELRQLCVDMTDYLMPLAEQRSQMLRCETPSTDLTISADRHRIKQLLLNLLDNAIKYTGEGGQITLHLKTEGHAAILSVTDTGRGIPAEDVPHVFERFFRRSAKTADRSATGSGLGLSIVKWIVDAHEGEILVQSELGQGTTFEVRFPLSP
jgi:two-component system, OmpR family, sensor kinase